MTDFTIYTVDLDTQRPNPADNTKVLRGDPPRTAFSKYNDLLLALQGAMPHVSNEAPNPTVPFMKWFDTSVNPPVERYRNSANTAWLLANPLATTNSDGWMSKADKAKLDGVQSNAYLLDRANHTGTQAIGTVSGLQTALDAKATQTALDNLAAASVAQADVGGGPNQVPSNQHLGALAFMDAIGIVQAVQHTPDAKPGSSWKQVSGNGFTEKFVDPAGNIIDVTPQTVPGALAQMQGFGLGTNRAPDIANLQTTSVVGGMFTALSAVAVAAGLDSFNYTVLQGAGTSGSGWQMATPITSNTAYHGRKWHRTLNGGVWSAWREFANTESPAFTGTPSAPSLKLGNVASTDVNTLDYYEEGSFTPSLRGKATSGASTYSIQSGGYTRIGNRVFWEAYIMLASWSGMVGQLQLSGLPFNVANASGARGAVTIGYFAGFSSAELCDFGAFYNSNTATIDFLKRKLSESVRGAYPSEDMTQTAQIYLSGHYRVN